MRRGTPNDAQCERRSTGTGLPGVPGGSRATAPRASRHPEHRVRRREALPERVARPGSAWPAGAATPRASAPSLPLRASFSRSADRPGRASSSRSSEAHGKGAQRPAMSLHEPAASRQGHEASFGGLDLHSANRPFIAKARRRKRLTSAASLRLRMGPAFLLSGTDSQRRARRSPTAASPSPNSVSVPGSGISGGICASVSGRGT